METNDTSAAQPSRVATIRASTWRPHASSLKHVFLAGDLKRPVPHPYFQRSDVEIIICEYMAGDHGEPHWHARVDEMEMVLEGRVGYYEVAAAAMWWFEPGDLVSIPRGTCVRRVVNVPSRSLTIKIPSSAEKIYCRACSRTCDCRLEPFIVSRDEADIHEQ